MSNYKKNIWNKRKGNLKDYDKKFSDDDNDDLFSNEDNERELIGRIQQRLGVSREEARNIIRNSELM